MDENEFATGSESGNGADSWDGADLSGVSDDGGSGDETPSPETLREIEEDWYRDEEKRADKKDGDQTDGLFRLKHLDKTLDVKQDELIRLAQKGLDYDRIRGKYSELSAFKSENAKAFDYLTRIAGEKGVSVKELVGDSGAESGEDNRLRSEIGEFLSLCPDAQINDIEPEVWRDAASGMNLFTAYTLRQNEKLRAELEAERQNRINREKGVLSRSSDGSAQRLSELERLWYEDD